MKPPLRTPDEAYRIAMLHNCGDPAFFLKKMPAVGEYVMSRDALFPNGTHPKPDTQLLCGSCGAPVDGKDLRMRMIMPQTLSFNTPQLLVPAP